MRRVTTICIALIALATCASSADHATQNHPAHRAPELKTALRSDGSVELSWHSYADSLCLERRVSEDELFSVVACFPPRKTKFVDTTLAINAAVHYRLRPTALRYDSEIGPESVVTAKFPAPPPPNLIRIAVDSVRISVDSVCTFAQSVLVERRIDGIFTVVGKIPRGSLVFEDGGLKMGNHHYLLRYEGARHTGSPSREDSVLLDLTPPLNLSTTYLNDHTVSVHWQPTLQFPCGCQIEKRSPAGTRIYSVPAGSSVWTDDSLRYDETYYYRVRLVNGRDSSDYSVPVSAHYVLRPVVEFRADPVHDLVVHLTWGDPDSLTDHYLVDRSKDSLHFSLLARLNGHNFAYSDSLSERGSKFWYRITSVAWNGVTAMSNVISETIPQLIDGMVLVHDSPGAGFYCDALEVSSAQFAEFCHETGRDLPDDPGFAGHSDYWSQDNKLPAVNVSWNDAVAFCNWRSNSVGLAPVYDDVGQLNHSANGYRLPARAQFISALRGAADTTANLADAKFSFGAPVAPILANVPAALIYNLIGNVWEWINDSGTNGGHVILGGAFSTLRKQSNDVPEFCYRADYVSPTIGFRCILPADKTSGR